jgi:hypothetical protein
MRRRGAIRQDEARVDASQTVIGFIIGLLIAVNRHPSEERIIFLLSEIQLK